MKKQTLAKQDIQQKLLLTLSALKKLSLILGIMLSFVISAVVYVAVNYNDLLNKHLHHFGHDHRLYHPVIALVFSIVCVAFISGLLLYFCYILYNAKTGKFTITKESLYSKKKELIFYYRRTQEENSFYFPSGRIAVDKDIYDSTKEGDSFYVVVLKGKKVPSLIYSTKDYEI